MLEQPFPVKIVRKEPRLHRYPSRKPTNSVCQPSEDRSAWCQVKEAYLKEGIAVFADESVATVDDIDSLKVRTTGQFSRSSIFSCRIDYLLRRSWSAELILS